jgi:coproporphyrinogen III oxidase
VNFSAVEGKLPEKIAKALNVDAADFFATGVSIVMHPNHPLVPIIHMNVRYFELSNGISWFGGGIDLTPHYINKEEAKYFHEKVKAVCDNYNSDWYPKFKNWADDYFFIPHRNETRGVGGIFFDRLKPENEEEAKKYFNYCIEIGHLFAEVYSKLMLDNYTKEYNQTQKDWQLIRRSRYVEFNLVYDKGTKFGLDTNGRTESILMSMPPTANWKYNFIPEKNTPENETLELLKKGIDWV